MSQDGNEIVTSDSSSNATTPPEPRPIEDVRRESVRANVSTTTPNTPIQGLNQQERTHHHIGITTMTNTIASIRSWTLLASIHQTRMNHAISAIDEHRIVVAGGIGTLGSFNSVEMLDTRTNRWYDLPDLPSGDVGKASAVLNGYLYLLGGCGLSIVERVDIEKNIGALITEQVASMREARGHFVAVTDTNFLYVIGGYGERLSTSSMERYDPISNEWEDFPSLKHSRYKHAAVRVGTKIYVLGGYNSTAHKSLSSVEAYDIPSKKWEDAPDLPETLSGLSAVAINNRWIVATGGARDNRFFACNGSNLSYIYDTECQSWYHGRAQLRKPREQHGAAVVNNTKIVIVGGVGRTSPTSNIELFYSVESIDFKDLFPNWDLIGHFILLRNLVEKERATVTDKTDFTIQALLSTFDAGLFRKILSFLMYAASPSSGMNHRPKEDVSNQNDSKKGQGKRRRYS